jgi:peroxiredoxin
MQKLLFSIIIVCLSANLATSNSERQIPTLVIKTLDGREVSTTELQNDGKPFIVSFWATWCRPCLKELDAINEIYQEFKEQGFVVFAVSTDNARTRANVLPMVNGRGWEFEFFLDENGDFSRAMGVNLVPHTFVFDGSGKLAGQHTSFVDGMEWDMLEKLVELLENE